MRQPRRTGRANFSTADLSWPSFCPHRVVDVVQNLTKLLIPATVGMREKYCSAPCLPPCRDARMDRNGVLRLVLPPIAIVESLVQFAGDGFAQIIRHVRAFAEQPLVGSRRRSDSGVALVLAEHRYPCRVHMSPFLLITTCTTCTSPFTSCLLRMILYLIGAKIENNWCNRCCRCPLVTELVESHPEVVPNAFLLTTAHFGERPFDFAAELAGRQGGIAVCFRPALISVIQRGRNHLPFGIGFAFVVEKLASRIAFQPIAGRRFFANV